MTKKYFDDYVKVMELQPPYYIEYIGETTGECIYSKEELLPTAVFVVVLSGCSTLEQWARCAPEE